MCFFAVCGVSVCSGVWCGVVWGGVGWGAVWWCVVGCVCVMHCGKPMCTTTFTYHVLLEHQTEYTQALQSLAFDSWSN